MAVKKRNPLFVIVAMIITLGIYGIYWFYQTIKEMFELTGSKSNPIMWLIGLLIPIVNFYFLWKYSELVEKVSKGKQNKILIFVLWFIFAPISVYLIQTELNKLATA